MRTLIILAILLMATKKRPPPAPSKIVDGFDLGDFDADNALKAAEFIAAMQQGRGNIAGRLAEGPALTPEQTTAIGDALTGINPWPWRWI